MKRFYSVLFCLLVAGICCAEGVSDPSTDIKLEGDYSISAQTGYYFLSFETDKDAIIFESSEMLELESKGIRVLDFGFLHCRLVVPDNFNIKAYQFKTKIKLLSQIYHFQYKGKPTGIYHIYTLGLLVELESEEQVKKLKERIKAHPVLGKYKFDTSLSEGMGNIYEVKFKYNQQKVVDSKAAIATITFADELKATKFSELAVSSYLQLISYDGH